MNQSAISACHQESWMGLSEPFSVSQNQETLHISNQNHDRQMWFSSLKCTKVHLWKFTMLSQALWIIAKRPREVNWTPIGNLATELVNMTFCSVIFIMVHENNTTEYHSVILC